MFESQVITVDVSGAAFVDQEIPVNAEKLIVLSSSDTTATFRVDDPSNDAIPVLPTFEICPEVGQITRIYLTSAGAATTIQFLAITKGNANLYAAP